MKTIWLVIGVCKLGIAIMWAYLKNIRIKKSFYWNYFFTIFYIEGVAKAILKKIRI